MTAELREDSHTYDHYTEGREGINPYTSEYLVYVPDGDV